MARKRSSVPQGGDLLERGTRRVVAAGPRRRRAPRVSPPSPVTLRGEPELAEEPPEPVEPAPRHEPFFDEPFRDFEYVGGIHLTDSVLWCDSDRKRDLCFLSSAHSKGIGKNRRILATDKTLKILTRASGKVDALSSPYKRAFTLGPLRLELHPAGHVLGSAQLLIERDERRLVFASDVCTRRSATVERAAPVPCDVLVIPPKYGHPLYEFPDRDEVLAKIERFIDACFEDHATPVLFANPIGTAQELMRRLGDDGYKLRVHGSIYDVAKIYRSLGVTLPGSRRFSGPPARDEVVIYPPILKKHGAIRKLRKFRTAMLSGRAVEPGFAYQQKVDDAFPWSDTASYSELLEFIRATEAREVYLYGDRYVDELGETLRARGLKVIPLVEPKQLELL